MNEANNSLTDFVVLDFDIRANKSSSSSSSFVNSATPRSLSDIHTELTVTHTLQLIAMFS